MTKMRSVIVACAALIAAIGAVNTPAEAMMSSKHSTPAMHQRPMMKKPMMRNHRKMMMQKTM